MKSFIELLKEMAVVSATYPKGSKSKEYDWDNYDRESEFTRLLLRDIGSLHYKLYRTGNKSFYLTTKEDEYLGQLEGNITNNTLNISNSSTKLDRGFYNIIFTSILASEICINILSDSNLSTNAIDSYSRLNVNGRLLVEVYNPVSKEYFEFSKELLLKNHNVVSVREKNIGSIHEHFMDYYSRIHDIDCGRPTMLNTEFNNNHPFVDNFLFCENYS